MIILGCMYNDSKKSCLPLQSSKINSDGGGDGGSDNDSNDTGTQPFLDDKENQQSNNHFQSQSQCQNQDEDEGYTENKKRKGLQTLLQDVNKTFGLPISYDKDKKKLNDSIILDLELNQTVSKKNISIYEKVFTPSHTLGKNTVNILPQTYTTNKKFLKNTQELLKKMYLYKINESNISSEEANTNNSVFSSFYTSHTDVNIDEILDIWNEIKNDTGFIQKYMYIEYEQFKWLNNNELFLQILNTYSIFSPLLSLITPVFILIIPFFIIKTQGIEITFETYKQRLFEVLSNHSIFKTFKEMRTVGNKTEEIIYFSLSLAFYLFTIYKNIMICKKFYKNFTKMHDFLFKIRNFIDSSILKMTVFLSMIKDFESYNTFTNVLQSKVSVLQEIQCQLRKISPFTISNLNKVSEIGNIYKTFYNMHSNELYNKTFLYAFGFEGYIDTLVGINLKYVNKIINPVSFLSKKNKKKGKFLKMFYAGDSNSIEKVVKNNYNFEKNVIITGANASGKTTILKSILINVLLSQQYGVGCFESGEIYPFDNIYCYLNILDTSDRFSLFQSECNKCNIIIKNIEQNKDETHLCIFDELFSGTNPEEAVDANYAFLEYLTKYKNVSFSLTTHFNKLALKFKNKNNKIINKKMESFYKTIDTPFKKENVLISNQNQNQNLIHTYKLCNGINKIKGGIEVLRQLDFPKEILDMLFSSSL